MLFKLYPRTRNFLFFGFLALSFQGAVGKAQAQVASLSISNSFFKRGMSAGAKQSLSSLIEKTDVYQSYFQDNTPLYRPWKIHRNQKLGWIFASRVLKSPDLSDEFPIGRHQENLIREHLREQGERLADFLSTVSAPAGSVPVLVLEKDYLNVYPATRDESQGFTLNRPEATVGLDVVAPGEDSKTTYLQSEKITSSEKGYEVFYVEENVRAVNAALVSKAQQDEKQCALAQQDIVHKVLQSDPTLANFLTNDLNLRQLSSLAILDIENKTNAPYVFLPGRALLISENVLIATAKFDPVSRECKEISSIELNRALTALRTEFIRKLSPFKVQ